MRLEQKMAQVQGSLSVCAWFAVAAQVVVREISATFRCPEPCGLAGSQGLSLE